MKAKNRESLWESEEIYSFLICVVCTVGGDYETGASECGCLCPAFKGMSNDIHRINVFKKEPNEYRELVK